MKKILLLAVMMIFASVAHVQAAAPEFIELPDPDAEVDGVHLGSAYGDFYAYPTTLIEALANSPLNDIDLVASDWDVKTGSGLLGLKVLTGGNVNNDAPFIDALKQTSGSTYTGEWGATNAVPVDDLLTYLHSFDNDANVPVFGFDMNESVGGTTGYLWVKAGGYIVDKNGAPVPGGSWILNDTTGGAWEFSDLLAAMNMPPKPDYALAPQQVPVEGDSHAIYLMDNNVGGGRLDYFVVAPKMDLSQYAGKEYGLRIWFDFADVDDGFEEVYLLGTYGAPPDENIVPEPMSMVLFGLGLVGAAIRKRKVAA